MALAPHERPAHAECHRGKWPIHTFNLTQESKMHKCAVPLNELKDIRAKLYGAESTYNNVRKLKAVELQIKRWEAEKPDAKATA